MNDGDGEAENTGAEGGEEGDAGSTGDVAPFRVDGMSDEDVGETNEQTIEKLWGRVGGLRDKLASKGAPKSVDDYGDLTFSDEFVEKHGAPVKDGDAPVLKIVQEAFLESGVPVALYQAAVPKILERAAAEGLISEPLDIAGEIEAAGGEDKYRARLADVDQRLAGLKEQGVLGEAELDEARLMATTANGISVIEKLLGLSSKTGTLTGGQSRGALSRADVEKRMEDDRFDTTSPKYDKAFADETLKALKGLQAG